MKYPGAVFQFYIKYSIHVALAVLALSYITCLEFELKVDTDLLIFTFIGTIAAYNFIKNYKLFASIFSEPKKLFRPIVLFSLVCGMTSLFFLSKLEPFSLGLIAVLFVLCFLYAVPVFGKTLRMYAMAKMLVVALVWSGFTVLLPIVQHGDPISYDAWITFAQRIFLVWLLTVPFEIRDMRTDAASLGTLPQKFGIRTVKWQATFAGLVIVLLDQVKMNSELMDMAILVIFVIVCLVLVWKSGVSQSDYFAAFWVEALPILWLGMILLERNYLPVAS